MGPLKAARAAKAQHTVNEIIPRILDQHPRAKDGTASAEVVRYTFQDFNASCIRPTAPVIRIVASDMVAAARQFELKTRPSRSSTRSEQDSPNIGMLNPASNVQPGGGFLRGAVALEENLCMCTTLFASEQPAFYPLPKLGGIFTKDVLVFREGLNDPPDAARQGLFHDLQPEEYWYADFVSAAFLKRPEITGEPDDLNSKYKHLRDRLDAEMRIAAAMRMFESKGCEYAVLCAWGAGAYANPVSEVAEAFRKVLVEGQTWKESSFSIKEVVFAIKDRLLAEKFAQAFGCGVEVEDLVQVEVPQS